MKDLGRTQSVCFYGVGGQGVLTAAEVAGWAALVAGYHVKKTEVHGMAQRGGSVESYVRFGRKVVSPLPVDGFVDVLICLHEEEHPRLKDQLRPGGIDLFPFLACAREAVGEQKIFLNAFMLGVLSTRLAIGVDCWTQALDHVFRRRQEENRAFFFKGRECGGQR